MTGFVNVVCRIAIVYYEPLQIGWDMISDEVEKIDENWV